MAKTSERDVWDPPVRKAIPAFHSKAAKVVPDDWDDDDDEEESENGGEKDNATTRTTPSSAGMRANDGDTDSDLIWAEANKRAPMPELIVASASTGHILPPAAFQPALRILKRPSPNTSVHDLGAVSPVPSSSSSPGPASRSGSGVASPAPRGTLAEREAQYQEARSRIFGVKKKLGDAVVITRDPLGPTELEPASVPGCPAKGFGRGKK